MTEQEAQALLMQGASIDQTEQAAADLATTGTIDESGKLVPATAPNPDAAAMEWVVVPEIFAWAITCIFPEVQAAYTPEAKMDLARKIAPVAEKYGWNGPGNMPELTLAIGAIGFSMPAILAYRARKEAAAEAEAQGDQKPREASGNGG